MADASTASTASPAPSPAHGEVNKFEDPDFVTHLPVTLRPDTTRVVLRPFTPGDDPPAFAVDGKPRTQRIADRVLTVDAETLQARKRYWLPEMQRRHAGVYETLVRRFDEVNGLEIDRCSVDQDHAYMIGAFFSQEYAYESAALFNPSIVPHPDQSGVPDGALRFVLSLRGIGEGHISSITFRTGTLDADGAVAIDEPSGRTITPRVTVAPDQADGETDVRIDTDGAADLSEVVIFPTTAAQTKGIEDLRLLRFREDDGTVAYLGTCAAAADGSISQELLRTVDFKSFDLATMRGDATANKGLALFPRRIGGLYAAVGRQDGESIWYMTSDDPMRWDGGTKILEPLHIWEYVQIGNCGPPIEIDEGWLLLTHGVGPMRSYAIGACLLDRDDPTKVLGRMARPLIRPQIDRRDGYVPNVVYSCGALVHGRTLLLPHAIADSFTNFATMPLDRLLGAMETPPRR